MKTAKLRRKIKLAEGDLLNYNQIAEDSSVIRDFYIEEGDFLRLRNVQVGYRLPKRIIAKAKMKELRIYFSANNLLTLTNYQGFDPDIGTNGWILDTGIDKGFYPSNKSVGGGVKVTF